MVRKGISKVRTGCLTCKSRKVKCDEAKPACERCVKAGRQCDGYAPPRTGDPELVGWHRPRSLLALAEDPAEARALQYYCQAAGPVMSGAIDPDFWSRLVYQFSSFEPAVRHSVVSISSLYEMLRQNPQGPMAVLDDSSLALGHYNAAIAQLRQSDNQPLIVLACLLFICIEVLQDNAAIAIQHCRHGILLLNTIADRYPWIREFLVPIFRRMTLLPLFFGSFPQDFPVPVPIPARDDRHHNTAATDDNGPSSIPHPAFKSLPEARDHMWECMIHSMQLVRLSEPYRQLDNGGDAPPPPPPQPDHLLAAQAASQAQLDRWHASWQGLMSRPQTDDDALTTRRLMRVNISIRYAVCRIWTATALDATETCYDAYADVFRRCVVQAAAFRHSLPAQWHAAKRQIKFMLEMGYAPMLYFIAVKCRDLDLRLQALQLMLLLGSPRENLWDVSLMYARGLRIIEAEHGVVLDHEQDPSPVKDGPAVLTPAVCPGLPPEEWRVRGLWTDYRSEQIVQLGAVALGLSGDGGVVTAGSMRVGDPSWTASPASSGTDPVPAVGAPTVTERLSRTGARGATSTTTSSYSESSTGGSISSCCTSPASAPSPTAVAGSAQENGGAGRGSASPGKPDDRPESVAATPKTTTKAPRVARQPIRHLFPWNTLTIDDPPANAFGPMRHFSV
ncbi:hypothetical protein Micbo1qcDRAFT_141383 [Microdochium bolleyi]|uniref:Zn(2)-C6 fungal-type domain-containing protein n=1 Tax=Microdochium bolleyi TaxID=196109 RepID=A0A136IKY8_9PEZI|nr:hypothetical protein Micbo1qcDRAFT_141383 [Microdochium bolleyi]